MSFLAKLVLGSTEFNILTVEYEFSQMMDHNNRPNGAPKGGLVQCIIETSNNYEVLEWMIKPNMLKSGSIVFFRRDANSPMKTIKFNDAFCVYLKEYFNADGKVPMTTKLTLSARELKVSNKLGISNPWPGMKSADSDSSSSSNEQIVSFSPLN